MTAFQKAALRENRRRAAVEALRKIVREQAVTRRDVADRLNAAMITNHIGRMWNENTVYNFVRLHEEVTGERLVPWLNIGYAGKGNYQTPETVAYKNRRASERSLLVRFVAEECCDCKTYGAVASKLNGAGFAHIKGGAWTASRVMVLVKGHAYRKGMVLLPLIRRKGTKWGPKGGCLRRD